MYVRKYIVLSEILYFIMRFLIIFLFVVNDYKKILKRLKFFMFNNYLFFLEEGV